MEINSRIFGKIEIDDNKIITIPNGLLGFEKYTRYVIAYDSDKESKMELCGSNVWMNRNLLFL